MSDISTITDISGTTYDLKDSLARQIIPWGVVDSTSTSTVFTATVPSITELKNGTVCIIMNNKVTSATGCTININNLGAKPMYMPTAAATIVTTQFAVNYVWMLIYNEVRISGGCWDMCALFNTNTTYSSMGNLVYGSGDGRLVDSVVYRYQMLFQVNDTELTPLNNVSNDVGTSKAMLTNVEFDPFGDIYYYNTTTAVTAGKRISGNNLCYSYATADLRYTFNCDKTLTANAPFYLKVIKQSNGKVKLATGNPWAQTLPSTNDGYYYIYLGNTYSTYQLSLIPDHPVYYHDGSQIRELKKELPSGGTAGQFLVKNSNNDYDVAWVTVPSANGQSF